MKALPLSTNASAQQFAECAHACPPFEAKFKKLSAHTEADRCHMGRMWDWDLV